MANIKAKIFIKLKSVLLARFKEFAEENINYRSFHKFLQIPDKTVLKIELTIS